MTEEKNVESKEERRMQQQKIDKKENFIELLEVRPISIFKFNPPVFYRRVHLKEWIVTI